MKTVGLLAVMTAAGEAVTGLPPWLYVVAGLVGTGGLLRWYLAGVEKRMGSATAEKTEAESRKVSAEVTQIEDRLRKELLEDVERRMAESRDELRSEKAAHAQSIVKLAEAQASYAELEAKASRDRHDLREQLFVLQEKFKRQERELVEVREEARNLREEVATLRAQLGKSERRSKSRRDEDVPGPDF